MLNKKYIASGILVSLAIFNRSLLMYGLISKKHLDDTILEVTRVLGDGANNTAHLLLSETAQTETSYGDYPDMNLFSGYGVMQFDDVGINDTIARTPQHIKDLIKKTWGIDLDYVNGFAMQWSPLLSVVMARLKYRLIPQEIPKSRNARAMYWKKWYNSELGKGTVEHYLEATKVPRFEV